MWDINSLKKNSKKQKLEYPTNIAHKRGKQGIIPTFIPDDTYHSRAPGSSNIQLNFR